jgi:hypothetical protein
MQAATTAKWVLDLTLSELTLTVRHMMIAFLQIIGCLCVNLNMQ